MPDPTLVTYPTRERMLAEAMVENTALAIADIKITYCVNLLRIMRPHLTVLAATGAEKAMEMLLVDLERQMLTARSDAGRQPS